jgi:hypothetical protein
MTRPDRGPTKLRTTITAREVDEAEVRRFWREQLEDALDALSPDEATLLREQYLNIGAITIELKRDETTRDVEAKFVVPKALRA